MISSIVTEFRCERVHTSGEIPPGASTFSRGCGDPADDDAFIADIRSNPKFAAAANAVSQWADHLEAMERGIAALYRNPEMIDAFDELQAVIDRRDLSMKQKLIEIGKILTQVRDGGRSVN